MSFYFRVGTSQSGPLLAIDSQTVTGPTRNQHEANPTMSTCQAILNERSSRPGQPCGRKAILGYCDQYHSNLRPSAISTCTTDSAPVSQTRLPASSSSSRPKTPPPTRLARQISPADSGYGSDTEKELGTSPARKIVLPAGLSASPVNKILFPAKSEHRQCPATTCQAILGKTGAVCGRPAVFGYCDQYHSKLRLDASEASPAGSDQKSDKGNASIGILSTSLLPRAPAPIPKSVLASKEGRATRSATAQERDQLNAAVEKLGMKGLHPHQLDGLRWMLQKEQVGAVQEQVPKNTGGLIADDMGLGKTRQLLSLTLATWTRGTDSNRFSTSTLIVCDLGLFKTWEAEISKAVGVDRLPYILFHKSATDSRSKEAFLKMDAAEVSKYPIVITNYEPFKNRRSKLFTCLNAISWRRIILDEASKVKNAETNAAINLKRLTAWSRWCCTATPVENKLTDLQAHFEFLRSPHAYAALFDKDPSNWTFNDEQILRDTILRRTKLALASSSKSGGQRGGELILPQLWETSVVHSLSDDEVDRIMEARNEAPNGLVKALREVQAIQTPGPEDPSGSARLNTLMALLKDLRKKVPPTQTFKRYLGPGIPAEVKDMSPETTIFKIVIFSLHKADLDHIAERLTALEKSDPKNAKLFTHSLLTGEISKPEDRRTLIDSFLGSNPNHETNILLSTLHIGATGLNLQKANVVILYGHWYNPAIEQQAIARVHRIGSTYEKVWCFDLKCTEGMSGVMDRMEEIKDGKMELARAVMEVIEVEHVE